MTFLNPLLLLAIPLIGLPILIHLINQRRHKTVEWGAMQFLLKARKMSRGMARLKHVLTLVARMAVIAGLIFAISRPLATGWFGGLASGKPDTVIVLLDRSASMQQQELAARVSKAELGLRKIVDALGLLGGAKYLVFIDSATKKPILLKDVKQLDAIPQSMPTETEADIPGMLDVALDYISKNKSGRTDIWLCSDQRQNDWAAESNMWETLRSGFSELDGVRFKVLNYAEPAPENYSVVAENVVQSISESGSELVLDIRVQRHAQDQESGEQALPVEITINGVRSVVTARVVNNQFLLSGHRIPLDSGVQSGWGKVELPADANESDNSYYFAFAQQPVCKTLIVSDDPKSVGLLELVCSVPPDRNRKIEASIISPADLNTVDWNEVALLIWNTNLPQSSTARQIENFVNRGCSVVFFPPENPDQTEFQGVQWSGWQDAKNETDVVQFWRKDDDLLRNTRNGDSLPLDELIVRQHCSIQGDSQIQSGRTLARLDNGQSLLVRQTTESGGIYFCSTLPGERHSNLGRNGVVLFAMLHRAMKNGLQVLGSAKHYDAGTALARGVYPMSVVSETRDAFAENRSFTAGVYSKNDKYVALNYPAVESSSALSQSQAAALFEGLETQFIEDSLSNSSALASEIWKLFVAVMGLALIAEALLTMPARQQNRNSSELLTSAKTAAAGG